MPLSILTALGGAGYSYIIDESGKLVFHNKSMDYNIFFTVLANADIKSGGDLGTIQKNMEDGLEGLILYDQLGTEQYAYYCPMGINSWTVVTIVSKKAITANTNRLTKELAGISIVTIVIFLILVSAAGVLWVVSQNQRHAAETKSAFLANMSHEIRTPMNVIVGMSEILLREEMKENQKECVKNILNSGKALLTIINDILDLSKIESGKFTLVEEEYNTVQLLEDIMAIAVVRIGEKPVHFLVEADPDLPAYLFGDVARIKQILINLVGNAAKFTEKGKILLKIEAEKENEKVRLTVRIEDTGIGIKKQDIGRLFVSFNQVNTHYSHGKEGTGLGLAIARMLSEMMGGDVTVESEYGKGSCFTVSVMQGTADGGSIIGRPEGAQKGISAGTPEASLAAVGWRILILESSDMMRGYYRFCMNRLGVVGDICGDREDFDRHLLERSYTHVLTEQTVVKELMDAGMLKEEKPIVLLDQKEAFVQEVTGKMAMIYGPLFSIQLIDRLSSIKGKNEEEKGAEGVSGMIRKFSRVRVLIVDDNELNREIAACLMEPYGLELTLASSGREAVEAVKTKQYDLVFLDHMMPEMDGVETLKQIRTIPGGGAGELPVAALTANATRDAQLMFKREGFDDFLAKPIEIDKLNEILERWLQG